MFVLSVLYFFSADTVKLNMNSNNISFLRYINLFLLDCIKFMLFYYRTYLNFFRSKRKKKFSGGTLPKNATVSMIYFMR